MIKVVIFDCDGVIIDSEPLRYESYKKLFLKEFDIRLPEKRDISIIGKPQENNIRYYLKKYGLKGNAEELIEKRRYILEEIFDKKGSMRQIDGLHCLVDSLKKNGYKTAVASNSSERYVRNVLGAFGIYGKFDCIVSGDMIKKGKPNPEIFILAAEKLKVKNNECLVLEDTFQGIYAAKKADMKCIAVTSTFSKKALKKEGADMVVDSLKEIGMDTLKNL